MTTTASDSRCPQVLTLPHLSLCGISVILASMQGKQLYSSSTQTVSAAGIRADSVLYARFVSPDEGGMTLMDMDFEDATSEKKPYRPEQGFQVSVE
jgi:hypothetical protein